MSLVLFQDSLEVVTGWFQSFRYLHSVYKWKIYILIDLSCQDNM